MYDWYSLLYRCFSWLWWKSSFGTQKQHSSWFILLCFQILQTEHSALTQISNMLVTLNSSVNFIIYCIYGDKFKKIFCLIFCQRCGGASAVGGGRNARGAGRLGTCSYDNRGRTLTTTMMGSRRTVPRLSATPYSGAATPITCTNTALGSPNETGSCSNNLSILSASQVLCSFALLLSTNQKGTL